MAHSLRVQSIMAGEAWQWEQVAAHIELWSGSKANVGAQHAFSFLLSPGPRPRHGTTYICGGVFTSVNPI